MAPENDVTEVPADTTPVASVPDQEATAPLVTDEPETPEASEAKTFSQEELDAAIAKRLARAERQWKREAAQQAEPAPIAPANDGEPLSAEEIIAQYEATKQQQALISQWSEREEVALEKYPDFEQVAYNPSLPITDDMAMAIQSSEIGGDILYSLGSNPKECARIAALPPILRIKELGRIEANLAANPPAKKSSSAPAPISPVTPRASGGPAYDTTDPRSLEKMGTSAWIAAERQRQIKKLEARQ
jgi:hypothetical protein